MITRRNAVKAALVLPLVTLSPCEAHADEAVPSPEHVTELMASLSHPELFALAYLVTDLLFVRGELGVPREMTTGEAIRSGLLDKDLLRSLTTKPAERELMEVLIAAA